MKANSHSVFLLSYHIVLVVKYRKKVINDSISSTLKELFEYIQHQYQVNLLEWNHDRDHVHLLINASPVTRLDKLMGTYKSYSSRIIKVKYPEIRKSLWKEYFWSKSYCLLTTGGAPIEIIKQYIESQGEKVK